jgi:two-component system, NtrC family, C4-dicarboxylate transport response regulator DctD
MSNIKTVILIDDEIDVLEALMEMLELEGFEVLEFSDPKVALKFLRPDCHCVVLSDVQMPNIDGLSLLSAIHKRVPGLPVLLMSGHGDIPMATQAIKDGAYDFLEKPMNVSHLVSKLNNAFDALQLKVSTIGTSNLEAPTIEEFVIGESNSIEKIRDQILHLAQSSVDTIINGDTGTGKEVVANALHQFSLRKQHPFIAINCGGMTESIIESELFGHEIGSFTNANKQRIGKIEQANNGTLFLDEIESMPISVQIKLLRVLQERVVERVGGNTLIPVNFVVIAASKANLATLSDEGTFRKDLFYRLNIASIDIPKLSQRIEDVHPLFRHFVQKACQKFNTQPPNLHGEQLIALKMHDWPGNIRELKNVADRFALGIVGEGFNLHPSEAKESREDFDFEQQMDGYEKALLLEVLVKVGGDLNALSQQLNLPRKTLYRKLKKHNIDKSDFKS